MKIRQLPQIEVGWGTVDLKIFVVKIFSWFAQTTKIKKKHEIYLTTDNHYSQNIFVRTGSKHS